MENVTILETFTLPSKGEIYDKVITPTFGMRSMTTEDEMKRLAHSDDAYKIMSDIIDECILDPVGISAYDMHLGDYQYLLHRLRVVTYGSEYKVQSACPACGKIDSYTIDLDSIELEEYNKDSFNKYKFVQLPRSKKLIELNFQTPRMLDQITSKRKEAIKRNPHMKGDPTFLFNVEALIKTVDGKVLDPIKLDQLVRSFQMADTNKIIQYGMKLNQQVGLKAVVENICSGCGVDYKVPFRITGEFFGPSED